MNSSSSVQQSELEADLERLRSRLLDLSSRNPLLNYNHPRASSLRIVDEVPAIVLAALLSNDGFRFAPLAAPALREEQLDPAMPVGLRAANDSDDPSLQSQSDAERREARRERAAQQDRKIRELAQQLGINPEHDLPAVRGSDQRTHADRFLQTLLPPEDLEARLQKIRAAAITGIQETGANLLHFLFGFVEWTDVAGGKPRMAPLLLVPVTLSRLELDADTHTFPYTVAASGEEWSTNVTLQEKCRKDFGFVIPNIDPEENLEVYFARVDLILKAQPLGWRLRRQLTLGLVSFGKILMWRDLDANTWPEDSPLLENRLLLDVLGDVAAADEQSAENRRVEYDIDELGPEHGPVPPIVVPADSSQHSVLVDVRRGQNLVVQGPPGTGKSQTITNIIADALGEGKKVLFVAEKRTALEVVARRLADVGLGPFCLPLHSHTSNKREFLDGLHERIRLAPLGDSTAALSSLGGLVAEVRTELIAHAKRMNAPFGALGDTPFQIFCRARRLAAEIPERAKLALQRASIPRAAEMTRSQVVQHHANLAAFAAAHTASARDAPPGQHPWCGVTRHDLSFDDCEAVLAVATRAREGLAAAEHQRAQLEGVLGGAALPETPDALNRILESLERLIPPPSPASSELIEAVQIRAGAEAVHRAMDAFELARRQWSRLQGPWGIPGTVTESMASQFAELLRQAIVMVGPHCTIKAAATTAQRLSAQIRQGSAAESVITSLASELGVAAVLPVELAIRFGEVALAMGELPEGVLALRSEAFRAPNSSERLAQLQVRAAKLSALGQKLDAVFPPALRLGLPELRESVAGLVGAPRFLPSWFSGAYRRAVSRYRQMTGARSSGRAAMTAELVELLQYTGEHAAFAADPALAMFFGPAADGANSPFGLASKLLEWLRSATTKFRGFGEPGRLLAEAVWHASGSAWWEVGTRAMGHRATLESMQALAETLRALRPSAASEPDDPMLALPQALERLSQYQAALTGVGELARHGDIAGERTLADVQAMLTQLHEAWSAHAALTAHAPTYRKLGLDAPSLIHDTSGVVSAIRGAMAYASQVNQTGLPSEVALWLSRGDQVQRLASSQRGAKVLRVALASAMAKEQQLSEAGDVNWGTWHGTDNPSLAQRVARLERAIGASDSLVRYLTLMHKAAEVRSGPFPAAYDLLETGSIAGEQLPAVFDWVMAQSLSTLIMRERPELARFSGEVHEKRRLQFVELDEQFIRLTRQVLAQRASATPAIRGVSSGQVRELSEQSLIEHEISKTRRHIPIREMFKRAGDAIQALKPCIMMGPQAVAQYLPPGLFHFDLVIMDEASQIRPEEALGAIVRGKQLVVVGDPRQLGPTAFFSGQSDADEELEEAAEGLAAEAEGRDAMRGASVLERSESILLAMVRCYPLRMLRWHYRSRYPELIQFSNREFYQDDLVLFPHPGSERDGDRVNFRLVADGLYASSINHREARAVCDAVCRHATECPERTLMVVTMNQSQKDLIDKLIQDAEKDDVRLAEFRARHQDTLEPFDVKNLESVQGDERDNIYVSVTYGPKRADQRDKVDQNFGPINKVGGERRLNVLFTRAKYRLDVFCSFDPNVLRVTPTSPRGLCVLRDYLLFAKEKTLDNGRFSGKEPDSDFEIDVARALSAHGLDVHSQVGVAGYFLDLAVVHPKQPGRYILAVECDGATYHSAKSARDRDRLRQSVLEGLGWNVHRIWSTDWFRDPRSETLKTVSRVEQLLARADSDRQAERACERIRVSV